MILLFLAPSILCFVGMAVAYTCETMRGERW